LFRDAENCVALCRQHHKKTEGDAVGDVFAETITD
jgi:hypothetical protein